MPKRKKTAKKIIKPIDRFFAKRGPGRPGVPASEIRGRADHYRLVLTQIWDKVGEPLLNANTEDEIIHAFQICGGYYSVQFGLPRNAPLILKVIRDPKFPKRRGACINFCADSLAAGGDVTPRRSRDICSAERGKDKSHHHIIRREFYIECSCGYKGPARDNACRKCEASIPDWLQASGDWLPT
jgi:hypothetical protein